MDENQRRQFMITASAIGAQSIFRRHGGSLREFLHEYVNDADTAKDVAVKVFEYFCLDDDGKFNNFLPGVQLAIGFLIRRR